jgi:hypothetical protein
MAMLAYVFWHKPAASGDIEAYESALTAFQRSLADVRPRGFVGCAAHALDGAPWLGGGPVYEDWYLLDSWQALGVLNEAAVDARRRGTHDAVAGAASHGSGGVFELRTGSHGVHLPDAVLWLDKPAGHPHADFRERLARLAGDEGCVWERQLVLGPAPEYCVRTTAGPAAAPVAATVVQRRPVHAAI